MNSETPLKLRLMELIGSEKPFVWAKKIGLSAATFNRVWNQGGQLKSAQLELIWKKTGVSLSWLVAGHGPMYPDSGLPSEIIKPAINKTVNLGEVNPDVQPYLDAFLEVMASGEESTKLALKQNTIEFRDAVRNKKEIAEMKRDMDIIKKRLFGEADTDFKNRGSEGERVASSGENKHGGGN